MEYLSPKNEIKKISTQKKKQKRKRKYNTKIKAEEQTARRTFTWIKFTFSHGILLNIQFAFKYFKSSEL